MRRGVRAGPPALPQPQHPACRDREASAPMGAPAREVAVGGYPWEQPCAQPQGGLLVLREMPDTAAGCDPAAAPGQKFI